MLGFDRFFAMSPYLLIISGLPASGKRPYIDMPFEHEDLPKDACWEPLELNGSLLRLDTTLSDSSQRALKWIYTYISTIKSTSENN